MLELQEKMRELIDEELLLILTDEEDVNPLDFMERNLPFSDYYFSTRWLIGVFKDSNIVKEIQSDAFEYFLNEKDLNDLDLRWIDHNNIDYLSLEYCFAISIYYDVVKNNNSGIFFFGKLTGRNIAEYYFMRTASEYINKRKNNLITSSDSKNKSKTSCKSRKSNTTENTIVKKLIKEEKLKALREVVTSHGRIDILTNDELIEVKVIENYKEGIGQLVCYGKDYPNHQLRLHIFGKQKTQILTTISNLYVMNLILN